VTFKDITHPTYQEVHDICVLVSVQIKCSPNMLGYKHIMGISRGGLIPAVIMSHLLDLPLITVDYSSKNGEGDKIHVNKLPNLFITHLPILLVDDVAGSGSTIREIRSHYGTGVVDTFVVINKSQYPTDYGYKAPLGTGWITFPWETWKTK